MSSAISNPSRPWRRFAPGVLLVLAGFAAYLPIIHAGFIWDDDASLTANALIKASDGLWRFWFTAEPADYWPVSSTTLWVEWRLWGMNPLGYHLTNLALHLGEVLLLWAILRRLRIPGAYLAALLFALHPVNVESVAWIAQRKNLMAMLFFLLSILGFLRWLDSQDTPARSKSRIPGAYGLSLIAFILALLSKGSVAPLPLVLSGLILWRRNFTRRDAARLTPFFAAAVGVGALNVWFQNHGLADAIRSAGPLERILGAGAAIWFYVWKALVPTGLVLVYPRWNIHPGQLIWWLPLSAAIGLTALLWRFRAAWSRPWLYAWGYFCVMLVPAAGLTDVTFMQYSLVADHYQHLAIIGVVTIAAAVCVRRRLTWAAAVVAVLLGVATHRQCEMYRDDETLYRTLVARDPDSWLAANNLGIVFDRSGRSSAAAECYRRALRLNPDFAGAHYNLGRLLAQEGRFAEAAVHFGEAVRIKPHFSEAAVNWGSALMQSGDLPGAISRYESAIELTPDNSSLHDYLGIALAKSGRLEEAIAQFTRAVRIRPDYLEAHKNLGDVLRAAGRTEDAAAEYAIADRLKIEANSPPAGRIP